MDVENQTAMITGAASGIALLTAQRLAAQGARVVMMDVNEARLKGEADAINALGGGVAVPCVTDVRIYASVKAAAAFTLEKFGRIDIVVNGAGGAASRVFGEGVSFEHLSIEALEWGLGVNFKGPVYMAHAVLNTMIAQKGGVMILIGSIDGVTGSHAAEYSASKSGLIGLTKSLALIGAPHGVRACCVSPGPVLTRPAMAQMYTPMGRAAEPREVVDLILYLCSDKAAFITGDNYLIDGGRACGGR